MNLCPESSSENVTTIRIHLDQSENYQQSQLKGKRRNKIKMPLKKIPKRKQAFTEQFKICQDINGSEYPQNLSALIVSSLQQTEEDTSDDKDHQTSLFGSNQSTEQPISSGLPSMNSLDSCSSQLSDGGHLSNNLQMQMNSVSGAKQMNPLPPPLVSVVRSLMNDAVPSVSISKVDNTDMPRETTQATSNCQTKDERTGLTSNKDKWQIEKRTERQCHGKVVQSCINIKPQGTIIQSSSDSSSRECSHKEPLNWNYFSQSAKINNCSNLTPQSNLIYDNVNSTVQGTGVYKCSVDEGCLHQSLHGSIKQGCSYPTPHSSINKRNLNTLSQGKINQQYHNTSSNSYINQGYTSYGYINSTFPHQSNNGTTDHEYLDTLSKKSDEKNFCYSTLQGSINHILPISTLQNMTQSYSNNESRGIIGPNFSQSVLQQMSSYEPTNHMTKSNFQDHLVHTDQIKSDYNMMKQASQTRMLRVPNRKMSKYNNCQEAMTNKSYLPDMGLPLVQVKQPLMTPISPESKRAAPNRSLMMLKRQQEGSIIGAKGRVQMDNTIQSKENVEYDTIESSFSRSCMSVDHRYQKDDDDDDVIITGIVNLNELNRKDPSRNSKTKYSTGKRGRYAKRQNITKKSTEQSNDRSNDNVQSNRPRKYNKRGTGRKSTRGRYANNKVLYNTNLLDKSLLMSLTDPQRFSHFNVYDNGYQNGSQTSKEKTNSNTILIVNKNETDENMLQGNSMKLVADDKCNASFGGNENKRGNYSNKTDKPDVKFDWKSCLTIFDEETKDSKKSVEAESGTDSGDDDAVLRDLSEFLMLSEDRRISSKKPINPDNNIEFNYSYQNTDKNHISEPQVNNNNNNYGSNMSSISLDSLIESEMKNSWINKTSSDNKYSQWHSLYDNYPNQMATNDKYNNLKGSQWKTFLLTENDPLLTDSEYYNVDSNFVNRDRCLEEFINCAGYITKQDRDWGMTLPDMPFHKKRIYRKKLKTE